MSGYDLRGAAEPMGSGAWGSCASWELPHYSLLLRRETDCKAVLFFSRAAFCCCGTQSERERHQEQLSPKDSPHTHPGPPPTPRRDPAAALGGAG